MSVKVSSSRSELESSSPLSSYSCDIVALREIPFFFCMFLHACRRALTTEYQSVVDRCAITAERMSSNQSNEREIEPPSSQASIQNSSQRYVRQKSDLAWAHCTQAIEGNGKTVLSCLYCKKIIRGGGINRLKSHLAGEREQVEQCKKVPADVKFQMKQNIDECRNKKRKTQEEYEESNPSDDRVEDVAITLPSGSQRGKSIGQSKEVIEKCDLAISKWMIDAFVPFNAVNSAYYQPMIDAICAMGPRYKAPNFYRVCGSLLNKWVDDTKKLVESYRNTWKQTGYTLMADGWTDRCRRTLINFLVYCPRGTVFIKSVDASQYSKTADLLYKLFREIILFVGPENIVQIVTDNAANYVAAGRLLEAEFPKLYWSPCAAHCINLMLQDIGKLDVVEVVSQASNITKYIYNHCYALYLMRKHTGGTEILRPASTRFATNFIALQSILVQKDTLRAMVTSK
ncbi:PREDICTED: uncharacterized protein LOC109338134 [Lupinus angustifolius]|uniref:uncharacterized protein LOC109338134 n=1 Tax=Lupinus angustifolius TaxID=3871 RepID=UPI00092ECA11|nr:PREDICTED: uncharacterized protein LOC109338134 [Lupinus angustifolius]